MEQLKVDERRAILRSKAPELTRLLLLSMLEDNANDTFWGIASALETEASNSNSSAEQFLDLLSDLIPDLREKLSAHPEEFKNQSKCSCSFINGGSKPEENGNDVSVSGEKSKSGLFSHNNGSAEINGNLDTGNHCRECKKFVPNESKFYFSCGLCSNCYVKQWQRKKDVSGSPKIESALSPRYSSPNCSGSQSPSSGYRTCGECGKNVSVHMRKGFYKGLCSSCYYRSRRMIRLGMIPAPSDERPYIPRREVEPNPAFRSPRKDQQPTLVPPTETPDVLADRQCADCRKIIPKSISYYRTARLCKNCYERRRVLIRKQSSAQLFCPICNQNCQGKLIRGSCISCYYKRQHDGTDLNSSAHNGRSTTPPNRSPMNPLNTILHGINAAEDDEVMNDEEEEMNEMPLLNPTDTISNWISAMENSADMDMNDPYFNSDQPDEQNDSLEMGNDSATMSIEKILNNLDHRDSLYGSRREKTTESESQQYFLRRTQRQSSRRMPLRLDVKRKLLARSDRIKSTDLHPTEPWMLVSLYNGHVHIWNYENQQLVKSFEVCELPVRCARFVPRKNWVITGSDDMHVRIFNYNTLERVHQFEAHSDYIRSIAVHPTQPFILTSSDDMLIKLWDWDNKWQLKQTFEGHTHYVMQLVINPKDNNTFATASLDKTVKVWQFGSAVPNFTLEGHEKGVNCVDYYHGGDKPYLISGADDHLVKIWDYQNKTCVATLTEHTHNVSAVCFHPELPIIITGSEDSSVRIWHANTYRLETTMSYGLERVWCITAMKGSNTIAIGYDEGSVAIKLGREEPAVSMDKSGKILWAKHSEIQQANLKTVDAAILAEAQDGERLALSVKDMGACEIYPQTLQHNSNGRYVVACGDGEYIVYTATALRNKAFGSGLEFVWGTDPNIYAVRESGTTIKIQRNFKEIHNLRPDIVADGIDGGVLLAVRAANSLCFYDWESAQLVRRIEIAAKHVYWSDDGTMAAIAGEESFYVLKYNAAAFANAQPEDITDDGIEDSFEVIGEQAESVKTGIWVGACFIFTTALNRLSYFVGGEIVTIAHLDRPIYLLDYVESDNRVYACDKDHNIVSYKILLSVLRYQTAVMIRDFSAADQILATIPKDQRTRVAQFLEKQGFRKQALAVSQDPEHRFELALSLGELSIAKELAEESDSEEKWRQLAQAATLKSDLKMSGECLSRAKDYGGLLLLASCAGSSNLMNLLANDSTEAGQFNVAFLSRLLLGETKECLNILVETDRLPEAALFARAYCPSEVPRIVSLWREKASRSLSGASRTKVGEAIADPVKYENLFPGYTEALKTEAQLQQNGTRTKAAPVSVPQIPASAQFEEIPEPQIAPREETPSPHTDSQYEETMSSPPGSQSEDSD